MQAVPAAQPVKAVPTAVPAAGGVRTVKAASVPPAVAAPKVAARPGAPSAVAPKAVSAAPKVKAGVPAAPAVPPPSSLPAPTEVGPGELDGQMLGTYQLHRKIADGRLGTVYAGLQTSINRSVALEVLDSDKAEDQAIRNRFIADARAKAQVQHPSILAVYEAGEAESRVFYAHEFVDGRTLAELKTAGVRLKEPVALKIMRVTADGLAYFNNQNIPHHELDASSIYLGADGEPRLSNLATQVTDGQLSPEEEIQAFGRIMLSVLPSVQSLSQGLRELLKHCVQQPQVLKTWGEVLQAIKAIEPKVIPVEAAKISAQDRAAIAAVEQMRKQQKRRLIYNVASAVVALGLLGAIGFYFFATNERSLDEQVQIPAGEFVFGNGEKKTLPDFWIDKYEVTYGQYAKFVRFLQEHPTQEYDSPLQPRSKASVNHIPPHWEIFYRNAVAGKAAHSTPIDLNCPMMEVDYWDAFAYAKWKGRELPTEEEWEKAARGTDGRVYPWGNNFDPKNVNSNADFNGRDPGAKGNVDGYNFWNPVDKVKGDKSPFGVIGMAGNVREWTSTLDPVKKRFVVKGGSFMSSDVRLDQRIDSYDPNRLDESLGFRTVSHTPPKK